MEKKNDLSRYEKQAQFRIKQLIAEYCDGSQQRFSEKTGVNKGAVSQYVNGKNTPSNITSKKIADVFNVAPAWVMGFDVPKNVDATLHIDINSKDNIEYTLLTSFRRLNDEGKNIVINHAIELSQDVKYSQYLKDIQDSFNDNKLIDSPDAALLYLQQADQKVAAFAASMEKEQLIAIANAIKEAHNGELK